MKIAETIPEAFDKAHPIPIPKGPVLEKIMIILMERSFLDSFLLKLIPFIINRNNEFL